MKIDIFSHILPAKYKEALDKEIKSQLTDKKSSYKTRNYIPSLFNLDYRFRIMDKFDDLYSATEIADI